RAGTAARAAQLAPDRARVVVRGRAGDRARPRGARLLGEPRRHSPIAQLDFRAMAIPGQPAAPPDCPPGWSIGPADFVGIGADRSGTTWWHSLISSHPQVSVAPGAEKEVHFFDPFWDGSFGEDDAARYREQFPRAEGAIAGEWTPR